MNKRRVPLVLVFLFLTFFSLTVRGKEEITPEEITLAAAADLKFALDEIVSLFSKDHPEARVETVYGSSGKFYAQIQQGAPYDLFFSADVAYPLALSRAGLASSEVHPYGMGRLALWSATGDVTKMTLAGLADPAVGKIAMANPRHAPYGQRAEEALRAAGVWERVEPRLVFGENVAQAAQFVQTGNAQYGIIALSLARSPELSQHGSYALIPDTLHQPLQQGFVITRRSVGKPLAQRFARFIQGKAARAIMTRYGFALPDQAK